MARTMGYCKWRNSLQDLSDIRQRLDETYSPDEITDPEELAAYEKVIEMCGKIAEDFI